MKRILIPAAIAAVVVIAAVLTVPSMCRQEPEPAGPGVTELTVPEGFQHDPALDAAGFYMPAREVQVGMFQLNHVAMGAPSDFEAWEAGEREAVYGPIFLQFDDVTTPTIVNELGGVGHERTVRVLPDRYQLSADAFGFAGQAPELGPVTFVGQFDAIVLENAKEATDSGEAAALTGDLRIGDALFEDVEFTYWIGD